MPQYIEVDGEVIEFPDGMTDEEIAAAIQGMPAAGTRFPALSEAAEQGINQAAQQVRPHRRDPRQAVVPQFLSGVNVGIAQTLGLPGDIYAGALQTGYGALDRLLGTNIQAALPETAPLGSEQIGGFLERTGSILPPPETGAGQFARRAGESVGAAAIPVGATARTGAGAGQALGYALAGGLGGATAQQVAPGNVAAELAGEFAGSIGAAGLQAAGRRAVGRRLPRDVPTTEQLRKQASDLYDQAAETGVTANPAQTEVLSNNMRQIAQREGLITPRGRIHGTMPKVKAIIDSTDEYASIAMTPKEMQSMRRTIQAAAGSADPAERRIGSIMLDEFDNFAERQAPEFAQAKQIYSRVKRAELLEQTQDLAEARAAQFTGSGLENAIRTEYRALDRKLIKDQLRGFSKAEQEAIRRVARGTFASNIARNVGRFSPTGPVSGAVTLGGGYALGGPVGAAIAGGIGAGGRKLAERMAVRGMNTAEMLVRAGVPPQQLQTLTPEMMEGLAAVLATHATIGSVNAVAPELRPDNVPPSEQAALPQPPIQQQAQTPPPAAPAPALPGPPQPALPPTGMQPGLDAPLMPNVDQLTTQLLR